MTQAQVEKMLGDMLGDGITITGGLKYIGKAANTAKQVIKEKSIALIESTAQAFKNNESRIPLYEKAAAKLKALRNKKSLISTKTTAAEASSSANKVPAVSKTSAAASSSEIEQAAAKAGKLATSSEAAPALRALEDLKPLGRGSTGRSVPENLIEQLALEEIMSNPALGKVLDNIKMADLRWHEADGWVKMGWQSDNLPKSTQIHYVAQCVDNVIIAIDDFKFKVG